MSGPGGRPGEVVRGSQQLGRYRASSCVAKGEIKGMRTCQSPPAQALLDAGLTPSLTRGAPVKVRVANEIQVIVAGPDRTLLQMQ